MMGKRPVDGEGIKIATARDSARGSPCKKQRWTVNCSDDQIKHQLEENIKIVTFSNCNMLAGTTNADLDERSQAAKTSKVRG